MFLANRKIETKVRDSLGFSLKSELAKFYDPRASSTDLFSLYIMMCINFPIIVRVLQNNESGTPLIFTITVVEYSISNENQVSITNTCIRCITINIKKNRCDTGTHLFALDIRKKNHNPIILINKMKRLK
jgi:hypothetical protein